MCKEPAKGLKPVTVVIPTHNSGRYLESTLQSLFHQTIGFSEMIIIDDNSQDNTWSIILKYSQQYKDLVKTVRLEKNHGVSYARNLGIKLAGSDWILFMDHDDIAEKNLLESELGRLEELTARTKEKWVLSYSAYRQISEDDEFINGVIRSQQVGRDEILGYQFTRNNIITTSGVLANKYAILKGGGFDESLIYSQDWDLWLKLAQVGGFAYADEPLIRVRRHSDNTSNRVSNFINDELMILRKYNLEFIRDAVYRRCLPMQNNKIDFVSILYRLGYWDEGADIIREVIRENGDSTSALFQLGLYYLNKQAWDSAEDTFSKAVVLDSRHGAALNNLGVSLAMQGKSEEASTFFKRAVVLYPNYNDVLYNLKKIKDSDLREQVSLKITWRELRPVLLTYTM